MKATSLLLLTIIISVSNGISQSIDTAYYRSPVDFPISLSGNFGELRKNHFHSGIDIRTGGEEGKVVYAVADGYVSRIKVSPFGYGNALYITHKNGQVSVYGHLQAYNKIITNYLKAEQYKKESFEVDLFPTKNELRINKGDTVALSGNTGGSEAPHLHFEIRDDKTEWTKNPLLNGFSISDSVKPEIYQVAIYPRNATSTVDGTYESKIFPVKVERKNLSMKNPQTIQVSGDIGFAIETNDEENDNAGKNGTYAIQLFIDGIIQYDYKITQFAFDQTRNINAHIDYQYKKKNGVSLQKCFVEPNNKFPCYKTNKNNGIFTFSDDSLHLVKIVVSDIHNNQNTLLFVVQSKANTLGLKKEIKPAIAKTKTVATKKQSGKGKKKLASSKKTKPKSTSPIKIKENLNYDTQDYFYYNIDNEFSRDGVEVFIPKGTIQNDINFEYNIEQNDKYYSPIYKIHREDEGLLSAYILKIKTQKWVSNSLKNKLLIASINPGGSISAEGGNYNETTKTVDASLKDFGYFTIVADTTKPAINRIIIDKPEAKVRDIIVKISDNLSGIQSYRGTIDGNWILMQYDYKNAQLIYTFDEKYNDEKPHLFKITVTDYKLNVATEIKAF